MLLDKITVLYVSSNDIKTEKPSLDATWQDVSLTDTHDVHCIRSLSVAEIEYSIVSEKRGQHFQLVSRTHSAATAPTITDRATTAAHDDSDKCDDSQHTNVRQGEWVMAVYDDECHPGAHDTQDSTNTENISVVVRFVKQEKCKVLTDMTTSRKLDTDALSTVILESLE